MTYQLCFYLYVPEVNSDILLLFYTGSVGKISENSGDQTEIRKSQEKLLNVLENIKTTLKKEAKRGDLNLEVAGKKLELYDYSFENKPTFTCQEGSVPLERSCGMLTSYKKRLVVMFES